MGCRCTSRSLTWVMSKDERQKCAYKWGPERVGPHAPLGWEKIVPCSFRPYVKWGEGVLCPTQSARETAIDFLTCAFQTPPFHYLYLLRVRDSTQLENYTTLPSLHSLLRLRYWHTCLPNALSTTPKVRRLLAFETYPKVAALGHLLTQADTFWRQKVVEERVC